MAFISKKARDKLTNSIYKNVAFRKFMICATIILLAVVTTYVFLSFAAALGWLGQAVVSKLVFVIPKDGPTPAHLTAYGIVALILICASLLMSVITIFIAISIPTPKLTLEKVKVLTSAPIPGRKNQTDNISAVAKDRISPIKPKHK